MSTPRSFTSTPGYPDGESVRELPPYRALLVVDIKDFSSRRGRYHKELTRAVPDILHRAFRRCGLAEVWEERRFAAPTGDGMAVGFRSGLLPFLINPFLGALQEELTERSAAHPAREREQPLRMRVSITVGPVTDSGQNRPEDGSGEARIEVHRLLDSEPVRDLLTRSGPATRVAAILSARAFEDAVLSGFAADDPDLYVPAPVEVKSYQGRAYLRVPHPSGDLLAHGFRPEPEQTTATAQDGTTADSPTRPTAEHVNQAAEVEGTLVQARDITQHGVLGTVHNNSGWIGNTVHGPVHSGPGNQYNAPYLAGDGANYVAGNVQGGIDQQFDTPRQRRGDRE
ncbi:MAG TPA: hypothetical protein VIL00_18860 [Pseudonocardiaceae bacterium]